MEASEVTAELVQIGQAVMFVDEYGLDHPALITAVWDNGDQNANPNPSVNVVFASPNENSTDQYGRQLERKTSVVHKEHQYAHGMYWFRMSELLVAG